MAPMGNCPVVRKIEL